MQIAILVFPGSNCERETILAIKRAGMIPVEVLWNEPLDELAKFQGYVLVGGFSYEDRGRAGIIAAHLPIMSVIKQQSQLGKPVLGICNGAQILVESGLVPNLGAEGVALTDNKRIHQGKILGTGYYNAWVHLKPNLKQTHNAFTRCLNENTVLKIPVAHAEGRFIIPDQSLSLVRQQGLSTFQYCDEQGLLSNEFPSNPNGSVDNIAALSNVAGNVLAIMPHPERTPHGDPLFQSMRDYIGSGYQASPSVPTHYIDKSTSSVITPFVRTPKAHELIVELIIADNHALTIQQTLQQLGIDVRIKRQIHWQIECDSEITLQHIKASGVLYNEQKERLVSPQQIPHQQSFLVTAKDDLIGQKKHQQLISHFAIDGVYRLQRRVLWHIEANHQQLEAMVEKIIDSTLLFNPISHGCNHYV